MTNYYTWGTRELVEKILELEATITKIKEIK